jgi:AraC-like DNA-binding protein
MERSTAGAGVAHSVFASADAEETRDHLDTAYGWRLHDQRAVPGRAVSLTTHAAPLVVSASAVAPGEMSYRVVGQDYVVLDTLLAGTFELEHAGGTERYAAGDVFVANHPGAEFTATTCDIRVLTTTIPARLLAEAAYPDDEEAAPVRFTSFVPHDGDGRRWRAASRYAQTVLEDPASATVPLLVDALARQLAAAALVTFPNDAVEVVEALAPGASHDAHPDTLRRAVAYVEANPDLELTVADIARASHVSVRALQLAFRRHLDTTPLGYVRRVRLDQVHAELDAAVPGDGTTVTEVAARWGFHSAGRFAEQYRAAYGRLPRETLLGAL